MVNLAWVCPPSPSFYNLSFARQSESVSVLKNHQYLWNFQAKTLSKRLGTFGLSSATNVVSTSESVADPTSYSRPEDALVTIRKCVTIFFIDFQRETNKGRNLFSKTTILPRFFFLFGNHDHSKPDLRSAFVGRK